MQDDILCKQLFLEHLNERVISCDSIVHKANQSNAIYHVLCSSNQSYIVRFMRNKNNHNTIQSREAEVNANKITAKLEISPTVYYADAQLGVIISKFHKTKSFFNDNGSFNDHFIINLAKNMNKIHNYDKEQFHYRDNVFDRLNSRLLTIKEDLAKKDYELFYKTLNEGREMLDQDLVSSHRDLQRNILFTPDNQVYFIDFESASLDNRYYDLASTLVFFCNNTKDEKLLLSNYFDNSYSTIEIDKINKMKKIVYAYSAVKEYINLLISLEESKSMLNDIYDNNNDSATDVVSYRMLNKKVAATTPKEFFMYYNYMKQKIIDIK